MANHDNSYKLLFSHPEMVRDLLRGFIREAWIRQLDFSSLEKFSGGYVSDNLRGRESDVVWRVRWKGRKDRWLYVYVLLELQSTVDSFMAVRMMTYLGLLYRVAAGAGAVEPAAGFRDLVYRGLPPCPVAR